MDNQPTPSNSVTPPEHTPGAAPDNLRVGSSEKPAVPEVTPAPGASPAPQASAPAAPPATLSADDVAAAIAAVPAPGAPALAGVPMPGSAEDVDVIEPEWVAKAEEVVAQHQGDPYGEEEAIEDLQQDYLQKRYGHAVADPKADSSKPEGT
jgi:hypothetical protein